MEQPPVPSPQVQAARRERWVLAVELWLTLIAAAALLPVLADLWGATFSELAARMEHGLILAVVWPWEQARDLGWLPGTEDPRLPTLRIAASAAGLAGVLTLLAAALDPRPGERPSLIRVLAAGPWILVVGPPALLAALAVVFLGLALDPALMGGLLFFGAVGGLLGRRRRRRMLPWERSLSGLPPASWKTDHLLRFFILFGSIGLAAAVAALIALPVDEVPSRLALALDGGTGLTGPGILPWVFGLLVVLLVILAPVTRRALSLMTWEPWVAAAAGGVLAGLLLTFLRTPDAGRAAMPLGCSLGFLGALMAGAGIPWLPRLSPHPLRAVGRLGLPLAAALAVVTHVAATGFFGCEAVEEGPYTRFLTHQPGAVDLALVGDGSPGLFVAFGADAHVVRLTLDDSSTYVVEGSTLPLEALDAPGARVRPVRLGRGPKGEVFLLASVERRGTHAATALVELDPGDARPSAIAETDAVCRPASWGWNPLLSIGVVGCADAGAVLLYEPTLQAFIAREELRGLPQFSSLAIDPVDGSLLALARRRSPFLVRIDLEERRPVAWQFLGMSNLTLGLDDLGVLRVARFLGRQVLTFDLTGLEPADSRSAGFGLGPMQQAPMHDRVVAASVVDGYLYAVDTLGNEPTERLHVGGLVRALALGPGERTLYAAGICGVMEVDLDGWLQ